MTMAALAQAFTGLLALIISLTFHEAAHAFAAKWQGDFTAEMEGRLTFNPVPHIDPLGTILIPLGSLLLGVPILLGWAKPVPVNSRNFRDPVRGAMLVAGAGPIANLVLAAICLILLNIQQHFFQNSLPPGTFFYPFIELLSTMVWINAVLAIFNLIPIAPLDGGTILQTMLPSDLAEMYEDYILPYGTFLLIALMIGGGLNWIGSMARYYVMAIQMLLSMVL